MRSLQRKRIKNFLLKEVLENIQKDYDYIFIDCPPSLGTLTVNALTASHSVLIPIQCEYYALEGLSQMTETISMVKGCPKSGFNNRGHFIYHV